VSQRVLIVGVSECGKSSLARKLTQDSEIPVVVFDPMLSEWASAYFVSEDIEAVKSELEKLRGNPHIAVIDEAGDVFTVGQRENHFLFTRGRHYGMLPIAIAQRMNMIAPNVRNMATDLYLFESALEDCEILARDRNCPQLLQAAEFEAGDFFHLRRVDGKKELTQHRLW